jgi:hypothetical protein
MSLDSQITISRLESLVGTATAKLEREVIVGRFGESSLVIGNAARLAEEFANCPETPARILTFTTKYAPLLNPAKPEAAFRFELAEWRTCHQIFRNNWRSIAGADPEYDRGEKAFAFPPGSHFIFSRRGNRLQFHRFGHLLTLVLGSLPWECVRFCPAPECKKPFFIATHLKQSLCGNRVCIKWASRKRKLEYWNRNKPQFLAKRKRNREEQKHVVAKTK